MYENEFFDKAWALHPRTFEELEDFTINAIRENKPIPDGFEVFRRHSEALEPMYKIDKNGIARLPITGILQRRLGLFAFFFGGTSYERLRRDIQAALADNQVRGILLEIDSPGGTVHGAMELAETIYEGRQGKPIWAYSGGMMASAAYWIGAAAETVVAFDTSMVGSIGVAVTHYDLSEQDRKIGIKRTVVAAGTYKRMASDEKPLSKEGRELLQGLVDTYYDLFIGSVAKYRGVDKETAHNDMGDGRDFVGKLALDAGLVDHVGNLESILNQMEGGQTMTMNTFQGEHKKKTPAGSIEDQAKRNWEKDPDLREEFRGNFGQYLAYFKAEKKGLVKIKKGGGVLWEDDRSRGVGGTVVS